MSRYKIKSFEKVDAPSGTSTKHWYRFVIENDINTITALRSGPQKEVKKVALDSVKKLNEKYFTHHKTKTHNKPVNEISFSSYI